MTRRLTSSRLLSRVASAFPSFCAIQSRDVGVDDFGGRDRAWTNVAGLGAIPCAVESPRALAPFARTSSEEPSQRFTRIVLKGRFAAITHKHRAVIGGVVYRITTVTYDDQRQMTGLDCETINEEAA